MNRLVNHNMNYVAAIARLYWKAWDDGIQDAISMGGLALKRSVLKWDPDKNDSLCRFARPAILSAVRRESAKQKPDLSMAGEEEMPGYVDAESPEYLLEVAINRLRDANLNRRDFDIVVRHLGLGMEPETDAAIGAFLGVSGERARQLRHRAFERLKAALGNGKAAGL